MSYNMHNLDRHQVLGADGETMVWVYNGENTEYKPSGANVNYSYYVREDGERRRTRNGAQYEAMVARGNENRKYRINQPSYVGVGLSEDFNTFDKWVDHMENRVGYMCVDDNGRLWQLDKDLLGNGKLYSPENVCFLPPPVNSKLSNYHNYSFEGKKQFFKGVYEDYFEVFEDEVLEAFFDMSKFDFTLEKENRLTSKEFDALEEKKNVKIKAYQDISPIEAWNDLDNPLLTIRFLNGAYHVDMTRNGLKLCKVKFECVYEAVLKKVELKLDMLDSLRSVWGDSEIWLEENFEMLYQDKKGMLNTLKYRIEVGELLIPQWVEVKKPYKNS